LLFLFFSLAGREGFSPPWGCAVLFSQEVGREVMCTAFCYFMQATSELASREKWSSFFIVAWNRKTFHWVGVKDVTKFDSDWFSVFCLLGKEKTKRERVVAFFPQVGSWKHLAACAVQDFHGC
jgi:hypothetical protein